MIETGIILIFIGLFFFDEPGWPIMIGLALIFTSLVFADNESVKYYEGRIDQAVETTKEEIKKPKNRTDLEKGLTILRQHTDSIQIELGVYEIQIGPKTQNERTDSVLSTLGFYSDEYSNFYIYKED